MSNRRILENLQALDQQGAPTVLRCPIIPTVNDMQPPQEMSGKWVTRPFQEAEWIGDNLDKVGFADRLMDGSVAVGDGAVAGAGGVCQDGSLTVPSMECAYCILHTDGV